MVVASILAQAEFGQNDNREEAPSLSGVITEIQWFSG